MIRKHVEKNEKEKAENAPIIDFSPEIDFESNYVVLKFDKDIDSLYMQEIFGLKNVKSSYGPTLPNGKPYNAGIGRIVDGMEGIEKIRSYFKVENE